jgi:mRNA interferase RelE/StbE
MRAEFPPRVADIVRRLAPDLKCSVKQAVRALTAAAPDLGEPLQRELEGLRRYRVRRFRIVYRVDRPRRILQVLAVGHRRAVYEDLAAELQRAEREPARRPRLKR